jgi:hypothetical protein
MPKFFSDAPYFILLLHMLIYFVAVVHGNSDNTHFHLIMFVSLWSMTMLIPTSKLGHTLACWCWDMLPKYKKQARCDHGVIHSFAFGGRGYFLGTPRGRRGNKKSIFDDTLGYPGEGPEVSIACV